MPIDDKFNVGCWSSSSCGEEHGSRCEAQGAKSD
jgi:hypothetical protein